MKKLFSISLLLALFWLLGAQAPAEVPQMINYQGKLTTPAGAPVNDTLQMVFSIYADSVGGTALWTETQSAVIVEKGVFNVLLGSVDSIPYSVFDGSVRYLGVKVGDDPEITPRKPMVSVAYAYRAGTAGGGGGGWVDDGTVVRLEDSTDRVGVGTTSPSAKLDIVETSLSNNLLRIKGTTNAEVRFLVEDYQNGRGQITKSDWDVAGFAIVNKDDGSATNIGATNGDINFRIGPPDWDWGDESLIKLHINKNTGDVGIGTTSPQAKVTVADSNQTINLATGTNTSGYTLNIGVNDDGVNIQNNSNIRGFNFKNPNGTLVTITAGGNVGIGTTNPICKLAIGGTYGVFGVDNRAYFQARNTIGAYEAYLWPRELDVMYINYGSSGFNIRNNNSVTTMFMTHDGNVGIGTTSPAYKLDVAGDIRSTGTIYGNFSGTIDNALHWNGHNWGDTYPYSSNSDLVDGIHGTSFLRNDQSGTLNGSLTVYGRVEAWDSTVTVESEVIRAENKGLGQAIFGRTRSKVGGAGVSGDGAATGASDNSFGVAGSTHSPSGEQPPTGSSAGVYGIAANTGNGDAFGVLGRCWTHGGSGNPTAAGVFGWGDVTSGSTYGVWGETGSTQDGVSGVYGTNTALTGATRGTIGAVASTTAGAAGVLGAAPNTGAVRGVMGYCHSASGYAMYSDGNFAVPNPWTKSVIMPASKGAVKLYCQESPEVWFEDFGEGELNTGKAHVELDPLFLETVTINAQYPLKVFVQLNDECNGVFVKRGTTGFDVTELNNGKSNAHFTYRIVAKRKGCETYRLDKTELIPTEFTQPLSTTSTWKD